jgi:hypothetical protein
MGSFTIIYIPSLIKIGSAVRKLIGGKHRKHGDGISLILCFQNKESRLIRRKGKKRRGGINKKEEEKEREGMK